jgi:hypothetical protein
MSHADMQTQDACKVFYINVLLLRTKNYNYQLPSNSKSYVKEIVVSLCIKYAYLGHTFMCTGEIIPNLYMKHAKMCSNSNKQS